ncbi:MAG: hypothetical protein BM564_03970 [Bacteroidetes bacterium MedPE-SWsnd-G2]|nr:MAG: hypothetical protein BM564_03970 [Bacteroidetes bacterium MedPE-SWsnd-G2]
MKTQVNANKYLCLLLVILTFSLHGYSQTKIAELTFETAGGYTTSETEFSDANYDYFTRTDGSSLGTNVELTNIQGSYYFAAQDIDGEGAAPPLYLDFENIDITGFTNLEFRVHLAEDDDGTNNDWDASDYVTFIYDINNSGTFNNLLALENDGATFNTAPYIDTNFDGDGDGTEITDSFEQFTANITGSGVDLDIQIIFNLLDGDEDIAIDNIEIWGVPAGPYISVSTNTVSNLDYTFGSGPSAEQMIVVSGSSLVDDITLTAPLNFEISTASGSGFTNSLTLTETSGTVSDTNIYIRLAESLAVNSYGPSNLTATSNTATDQNIALSGTVSNIVVGCNFSDDFDRADNTTIGNGWVEVGGNIEITSNEVILTGNGVAGVQYLYQNMNGIYTTQFENATGILSWEFNMNSNRPNPSGFTGNLYGTAFILGGTDSDFLSGSGYAIILGNSGNSDPVKLISYNDGVDDVSTEIITNTSDFDTEHFSIKVTFDSSTDTWELFVRDDGGTFQDPSSVTAASSIGTGINTEFIDQNLTFVGPLWKHNTSSQFAKFDNICITEASACTTAISNLSIEEGSIGTIVSITGTGFTNSSTVTVNGVSATVNFIDANNLTIEIPASATTGLIELFEGACNAQSASNFTVLGGGSCLSSNISDLIISEIYDGDANNVWYVELYNPTAAPIDLDAVGSDYEIERYGDVGGTLDRTIDLTGTVAANSTFLINLGDSADTCSPGSWDLTSSGSGINASDEIILTKDGADVEVIETPAETGYSMSRLNTSTGPSSTYSAADWTINLAEDCSDLGSFTPLTVANPIINTQPTDVNTCELASFSIDASPGNSGTLSYEWYYNDGVSATWTLINVATFSPGVVTGENTNTISIYGYDVDGFQFYCDVTEDSLCTTTSNTVQSNTQTTTWDGTVWSDGAPDSNTSAILNASYNTGTQTDFIACNLVINLVNAGTPSRLTISDNTFVEVEHNIYVYGQLYVEHNGALKQVDDNGVFVSNNTNYTLVNKETAPLANWTDYTYWSTPVKDLTIGNAFFTSTNVYEFIAANYLDVLAEIGNTGVFIPGQDDYDDNSDAWSVPASNAVLTPGFGYAATHSNIGFFPGNQYNYVFTGEFNTGVINAPVSYNGANGDSDANLLGNPYPSAISTDDFFTTNAGVIDGVIYLWSHNTAASPTSQGDEGLNYSPTDYAIITQGSGATASSDGNTPNDFVPSGQGFFVNAIANGNVVFNNAMRRGDNTSNSQFFRTTPDNPDDMPNKLWVNLTTDTGVFNQILIAYVDGATNGVDALSYDAPRKLSTNAAAILYSIVDNNPEKKFAIQGKNPTALNLEEEIPIGISTNIENAAIYTLSIDQIQGEFMNDNTVYLKDNLFDSYHNLSESDYAFTLDEGSHDSRFELVFTESQTLALGDQTLSTNAIEIIDQDQQTLAYKSHESNAITGIVVYDVLGRQLATLKANSSEVSLYLRGLTHSAIISKIQLENGAVVIKKIVKRL